MAAEENFQWASCFVAAAVCAAGFVFTIFLLVKMGFPLFGILVVSLALYPAAIGYLARSVGLTLQEMTWAILIISGPTLLYGVFVNPRLIRLVLDFGVLAVAAIFTFAGFKLAQMRETNPS